VVSLYYINMFLVGLQEIKISLICIDLSEIEEEFKSHMNYDSSRNTIHEELLRHLEVDTIKIKEDVRRRHQVR